MTIDSDTLQLVAYVNIFVVGVVAAIVIQGVFKHFWPHDEHEEANSKHGKQDKPSSSGIAPFAGVDSPTQPGNSDELLANRHKLLKQSQQDFEAVLQESAAKLREGLTATTDQLNKQLHSLGNDIIKTEITRYHQELQKLREQTEQELTSAQGGVDKHQAELQAKLDEQHALLSAKLNEDIAAEKQRLAAELAAEQQKLLAQLDTKLGEAVTSFLLETMQHEVDLGAQTTYLTKMLEEHKDDLKRELGIGVEVAATDKAKDKAAKHD